VWNLSFAADLFYQRTAWGGEMEMGIGSTSLSDKRKLQREGEGMGYGDIDISKWTNALNVP
jgi:hypothetical protein